MLSLVAAKDKNGIIGRNGALPWYLPADFEYFKRLTEGHPIIMGRKTHESIGRELPGRRNIVITRNKDFKPFGGARIAHSIREAVELAGDDPEVFIIGGEDIYAQSMSMADRMYISLVNGEFEGDARFPEIDPEEWREIENALRKADDINPCDINFIIYERRK